MSTQKVFLTGQATPSVLPLGRFLPPVPAGVASKWLEANLEKGSWLLDPFGAAPHVAIEAAQAGYRVAVAANNPIARFLLEMQAQPPSIDELQSALAELGASRRAEERLEPHILDLYASRCPACEQITSARAFIWQREALAPETKLIHCEHCGHQGEHPTDEADHETAARFTSGGPHHARALERIAPRGDRDRVNVEEALEVYLPRAVYALFTILNRLDGLSVSERTRDLLAALMLHALDRSNTLWAHPSGRTRPKQLTSPPTFREHNIWRELESAIELWSSLEGDVDIVPWPETPPPGGGISLFEGRLREMAESLAQVPVQAILSALPRPNQAYWTLSALWAGWLWGREAIGPFASVLGRRRYDWAWHTEALESSLSRMAEPIPDGVPFFAIVAESEPSFNVAALSAGNLAGFALEGVALRREEGQLQIEWKKGAATASEASPDISELTRSAAQDLLRARGEPSHFQHLQAAALARLAALPKLGATQTEPGEIYTETKASLEVGLTFRSGFLRFGGSESSLEAGQWWLTEAADARTPLADRLEIAVVRFLLRYPASRIEAIDQAMCSVFPGLLTPPSALLTTTLQSYADEVEGVWRIRPDDQPKARREDLREMKRLLLELGAQLGYEVDQGTSIQWGQAKEPRYSFYPIASGLVGDLLLGPRDPQGQSFILLPGGRAQLVLAKLARDPRLSHAAKSGWGFLKFRHLRRLAENHSLTASSFDEILDLDPLSEDQAQAPLL
ncbi:MAG: hypothetical protein DWG76_05755 [Chloroflexi bacterium]|nr:hypothetical protein [Chloroflexota bacterium]